MATSQKDEDGSWGQGFPGVTLVLGEAVLGRVLADAVGGGVG